MMHAGLAPLWVPLVLIYRESVVCTLRVLAAREGAVVPARVSGKLKTLSQAVSLNFLFLFIFINHFLPSFPVRLIASIFNWIVVGAAIYSGIDYFVAISKNIKRLPWHGSS